jgi:hypothetical protein
MHSPDEGRIVGWVALDFANMAVRYSALLSWYTIANLYDKRYRAFLDAAPLQTFRKPSASTIQTLTFDRDEKSTFDDHHVEGLL